MYVVTGDPYYNTSSYIYIGKQIPIYFNIFFTPLLGNVAKDGQNSGFKAGGVVALRLKKPQIDVQFSRLAHTYYRAKQFF
jgi:hypothetical protein